MKAWAVTKYKQKLTQVELPEASAGPQEVLVEVSAVGLNHLDEMMRRGDFQALMPVKFPFVVGHELSGVVVALGSDVTNLKLGDRVYSRPTTSSGGVLTSRVNIKESELALIPTPISFVEAAGIPLVGLTAWQALVEHGKVQPGQKVLIHGGAGGVGIAGIQLAKHLGAWVAATAGTGDLEFVKALGADVVIDYKSQDFSLLLSDYDLVLDNVGGNTLLNSLKVLRKGGLAIGLTGPADPEFAKRMGANPVVGLVIRILSRTARKQARELGVNYRFLFMQPNGLQLNEISKLTTAGVLTAHVSKVYDFDQTPDALHDLTQGRVRRGKAVVSLND